jgi:hypothetical protein
MKYTRDNDLRQVIERLSRDILFLFVSFPALNVSLTRFYEGLFVSAAILRKNLAAPF